MKLITTKIKMITTGVNKVENKSKGPKGEIILILN